MDNLACHKRAGVEEALRGAGCRCVYLPPYSPDYNPIEQAFAKLKALLRKQPERTVQGLWDRLGRHLDDFSAAECRNYFRHAATPSVLQVQANRSNARQRACPANPTLPPATVTAQDDAHGWPGPGPGRVALSPGRHDRRGRLV
jgi:hypothetical protein